MLKISCFLEKFSKALFFKKKTEKWFFSRKIQFFIISNFFYFLKKSQITNHNRMRITWHILFPISVKKRVIAIINSISTHFNPFQYAQSSFHRDLYYVLKHGLSHSIFQKFEFWNKVSVSDCTSFKAVKAFCFEICVLFSNW